MLGQWVNISVDARRDDAHKRTVAVANRLLAQKFVAGNDFVGQLKRGGKPLKSDGVFVFVGGVAGTTVDDFIEIVNQPAGGAAEQSQMDAGEQVLLEDDSIRMANAAPEGPTLPKA